MAQEEIYSSPIKAHKDERDKEVKTYNYNKCSKNSEDTPWA